MIIIAVMVVVYFICLLVYDMGYLIASKVLGLEVTEFFIGVGKQLSSFTIGRTTYFLRAIPLTGGVRFDNERALSWRSVIFCFAGPVANIILAIAIPTTLYMVGYSDPNGRHSEPVIGYIRPGSPASRARLQPGDRILQIGSLNNPDWGDILDKETSSAAFPFRLKVSRQGATLEVIITPEQDKCSKAGFAGWSRDGEIRLLAVSPGSPAQEAGLKKDDVIVSVNGRIVRSPLAFKEEILSTDSRWLEFGVLRANSVTSLRITPIVRGDVTGHAVTIGATLASNTSSAAPPLPFTRALRLSINYNRKSLALMVDLLGDAFARRGISLFTRRKPVFTRGTILELTATISLYVGLANLLPVPGIPGGFILINMVQLLARPLSEEGKMRIHRIAVVCFVLLAGVMIYRNVSNRPPAAKQPQIEMPAKGFPCSSPEV